MHASRAITASLGVLALLAAFGSPPAEAGCGCAKPPPPPAAIRPNVTYAGTPVTLFGSALQANQQYTVTFTSAFKPGGGTMQTSVTAVAVSKRDLANAVYKTQLKVMLPSLPLGPASITVKNASGAQVMAINDASFTVAPPPLAIPTTYGRYSWPNYQAAVGRDGVVHIALDLSAVQKPIVFEAQALGYALRFGDDDMVFHNTQGFLMQLLVQGAAQPIPGMFVFPSSSGADSDVLHYSRHEFSTYFLQHQERLPHAVDASDGNWHQDGTRHVDHDHLILSIIGHLNDGSLPRPGATQPFNLSSAVFSLFYQGLAGTDAIGMTDNAQSDSYDPYSGQYDAHGDVFTNGTLTVMKNAMVAGDAAAGSFAVTASPGVTGTRAVVTQPVTFMDVKVPAGIPDLGSIRVTGCTPMSLQGPGSFQVADLDLTGGDLYVDNSAGPVTLYVTGMVSVTSGGMITLADPNPEKFAVYVASASPVTLQGSDSTFNGVIYAPYSQLYVTSRGEFFGAFLARTMHVDKWARVHYWSALRGQSSSQSAQ
jgi:hypothetical protein